MSTFSRICVVRHVLQDCKLGGFGCFAGRHHAAGDFVQTGHLPGGGRDAVNGDQINVLFSAKLSLRLF